MPWTAIQACMCVCCRAAVVGEKTFGKGVVQYYFPMDDAGSGLKVTVSKYLTPSGYDITRWALHIYRL